MNRPCALKVEASTALLLVLGFSGVSGWLGLAIIGAPWPVAVPCAALAAVTLPWGFSRLYGKAAKLPVVLCSAAPAVLLGPGLAALGIGLFFGAPATWGYARGLVYGPNIVERCVSPDGAFEAYVIDEPSIDGPDETLYVQRADLCSYVYIAELPADVEYVREIAWSPRSDMVVFLTNYALIAARVPGFETVKLPFGGEWRRTQAKMVSTFAAPIPKHGVERVEFPEPGVLAYYVKGEDEARRVDVGALAQD